MKKPLRNLLPVVPFEGSVVTYAAVREYFGWKGNKTIRDYVAKGLLTRFRIGTRSKDCRITTASVVSLREHLNKMIADAEYAERAHAQTMRERRGLQQNSSDEVLLDEQEIIRRYNEGRKSETLPDPTPDTGTTYEPPAPAPRRVQRVGFSNGPVSGI